MRLTIAGLVPFLSILLWSCRSEQTSKTKDEFSGVIFYYYDKSDRLDVVAQIGKALDNNYSLRDIKKRRIGVDTKEIFDQAIATESGIGDVNTVEEQAASNLEFLDRMHKTISKFQDTHLSLEAVVSAPVILNGIEIRKVADSYHVVAMRPKLVEYVSASTGLSQLYNRISLGDRVVKVDGKPVGEAVGELIPFQSASTSGFAELVAAKRLNERDYAYPKLPYTDYEMVDEDGSTYKIRLPFFYQVKGGVRPDASALLKSRGFLPLGELKLKWNEERKTWDTSEQIPVEGFDKWSQTPAGLKDINEWDDSSGDLAVRTGYLLRNGKSYGVMQLYTFMVSDMKNRKNGEQRHFTDTIKNFVKELKDSKSPLILDIRINGGGNTDLPPVVLEAIAKTGAEYPTFTKAYRVTRHIRQMLETYEPSNIGLIPFDSSRTAFDELQRAIAEHRSHTPAINYSAKIKSSIGGYDQPVVVMLTPACISSCDITSMLMDASGRVKTLGTHANGTGAGMTQYNGFTGARFVDDFDILSVNIPNFLFGRPDLINSEVRENDSFYDLNSENIPVKAQVQYDYTMEDILDGSKGWFNKAIEMVEQ